MECTLWPEGIPQWLGGSGFEWHHCCVAHDLSDQSLSAVFQLGKCVAGSGFPIMGVIMVSGLLVLGPIYRLLAGR